MNLKHGTFFADQSKHDKSKTEICGDATETKDERNENQSQTSRNFENISSRNEIELNKLTTSGQSDISTPKSSHFLSQQNSEKMDRENFYHWGAIREIMDNIRRRNNSPETRRLIEQRNALSRPGTLRRRYDHQTQRTVFAPSRPN